MNHFWTKFLPSSLRTRLDGRFVLQKTIVNTGWLFFDQIFRLGIGMFVGILFARYFGPEEFGLFNYAAAFVALFSAIATLGLDSVTVRDIIKAPEATDEILGTAFALKLASGLLMTALTVLGITFLRPGDALARWLVAIISAGAVFQAFDAINFWFQSRIESKFAVYAKSAAFLVSSAGRLVLIYIKAPLIAFAWICLAEAAMGAIGLMIVYRGCGNKMARWRLSLTRASGLLRDSWPLILSGMMVMAYMRIDQIMLGEMIGNDAVGVYSAAIRLSEGWYFIPMAVTASVYPSILDAKRMGERVYQDRLQKLYFLMSGISIAVSVPLSFLSDTIINILYGSSYAEAGAVLSIHIWSSVFVFLGVASSQFLLAENLTGVAFARTSFGAVVNIALNLVLIPPYGAKGAAIATLISYFCATFFIVLIKKTRRQSIMMFRSLLLVPVKNP